MLQTEAVWLAFEFELTLEYGEIAYSGEIPVTRNLQPQSLIFPTSNRGVERFDHVAISTNL